MFRVPNAELFDLGTLIVYIWVTNRMRLLMLIFFLKSQYG